MAAPTVIDSKQRKPPDGRPERWHLVVLGRDGAVPYLLPVTGEILIGRAEDAHIRIVDPKASRSHARVHVTGELDMAADESPGRTLSCEIEDLGSANGTRVCHEPLPSGVRARLLPGDWIAIGNTMLVLHGADPELEVRRVWVHGYLETRLIEECAGAQERGSQFALVRIHVEGSPPAALVERRLADVLRGGDLLATYGPREYQALLLDSGAPGARGVAEAIEVALAAEGIGSRTAVACFPVDGTSPQVLLGCASERIFAVGAHAAAVGATAGAGATATAGAGATATPTGTPIGIGTASLVTGGGALVLGGGAMQELFRLAQRAAASDTNVLILGETGAGKEVFAETVHRLSPRAARPFWPLNCAAFSESLVESELFGFERGAFTGATHAKLGLLEAAAGGTLFLDEIGEMPLTIQAKLLRVIETRQVLRIGAVKPQSIDVRFVAATHRDLEEEVEEKRFREDLYFRLNVITLQIPPLRERIDEVEPLARLFLESLTRRIGRRVPTLSPDALGLLRAYAWPGNIRELRNVVERALVLCAGDVITPEHLPVEKMLCNPWPPRDAAQTDPVALPLAPPVPGPPDRHLKAIERQAILDALQRCHGNQTRAAELLGMPRRTFCKRVRDYDLPRPRA